MKAQAKLTALTLAAIMAAGASTALHAQGKRADGPRPMIQFSAIDTNGDGVITPDEIKAYRESRIKALDANGDGELTADEIANFQLAQIKARIEARAKAMVQRLDVNGDGKLSAAELAAARLPGLQGPDSRMMRWLDKDGDGKITKQEFDAAQARMDRSRGHERGERWGKHDGKRGWMHDGRGDGGWMRDHHGWRQGPGDCSGPRGAGMKAPGAMPTPPAPAPSGDN